VRPIVVAKETRLALLPDVPTFKEKGYNVTFKMFRGIAAPPGIPAVTAAYYENMMKKMTELPAWKEKYVKNYMLTPSWMGSKEFSPFVTQSEQLFKGILTELGLIK
jgi:putative tricarboxylic transport membrane protein